MSNIILNKILNRGINPSQVFIYKRNNSQISFKIILYNKANGIKIGIEQSGLILNPTNSQLSQKSSGCSC